MSFWMTLPMSSQIIRLPMSLLYYTTIPSRLAALKLRKEAHRIHRVADLVELAFDYRFPFKFKGLTIKPTQVKEEIVELLRILKKLNSRACLEIGTAGGHTVLIRPDN